MIFDVEPYTESGWDRSINEELDRIEKMLPSIEELMASRIALNMSKKITKELSDWDILRTLYMMRSR